MNQLIVQQLVRANNQETINAYWILIYRALLLKKMINHYIIIIANLMAPFNDTYFYNILASPDMI